MPQRHNTDFANRPVVWVVGASRGIGKEIAKQFAMIGCEVCLSSRSKGDLQTVVSEIIDDGGRASAFPCDVSKPEEIFSVAKEIQKQYSCIDILINNAGISYFKSFQSTTSKEFGAVLSTNLFSPILCIKSVLPGMIKRKRGWIINILSVAAVKTFKSSAAYSASKAGLLALSKVLREEVREKNIKVVNILPGATETVMWSAQARKKYSYRMMKARSVAEAVLSIYRLPADVVAEDVILKPLLGDIE